MTAARGGGQQASPPPGTITRRLGSFTLDLKLEAVPEAVRHEAKRILLDCLGCMVAGRTTPAGRIAMEFARARGGAPQATVVGGGRTAVEQAAFANAVLGNALDYEPVGPEGHVCAVAVPAALAAAEAAGVSGPDLLAALIAALEVGGRVGAALRRPSSRAAGGMPPVRGTPHAVFAATAACARLFGLDLESTRDALGIAGYSATLPTLRKAMATAAMPMTKYDHLGLVALAGVDAARLARLGFTGDRDLFEGELGFWRFSGALGCDWELLANAGGETWLIPETWYKPYPCILYVTPGIDAVLEVLRDGALAPDDLTRIEVESSHLHPGQLNDSLDGPLDPWMNYRFNVACAVYGVRPRRDWHRPEKLPPEVAAFVRRVDVKRLADVPSMSSGAGEYWRGWAPATVAVYARGDIVRRRVDYLPRLDDAQLAAKFDDNIGGLIDPGAAAALREQVWNLEAVASVRDLLEPLG